MSARFVDNPGLSGNRPVRAVERLEGVVQVVILLAVGAVGAAASFTHVHDWTMANSPAGTGDWFGWANACVSDLVPLGVGLEVRRRRRLGLPIGTYPIAVIVAAAALSLAGQFAQARPSIAGWLLAAVPALGFLALTKLILSRPSLPAAAAEPAAVADQRPAPDEVVTPTAFVPASPAPPVRVDGYAIGSGVVR